MAASKGWMGFKEPNIRLEDGQLRKPDLILLKGSVVVACDVTISWEGPCSLDSAYQNKVSYYSEPAVLQGLQRRYPGREVKVMALVLGARGIWCPRNEEVARVLGLNRRECATLETNVINGRIILYRNFMSAVVNNSVSHPYFDSRQPMAKPVRRHL